MFGGINEIACLMEKKKKDWSHCSRRVAHIVDGDN